MAPAGGCSRGCVTGVGHCHLRGGEGGCWPANVGPAGGLGGALLGGWAKPATHGCSSLAASSGGYLATPPTLAGHPCPAVPLDTCGQLLAGLGCCCSSLTTRGCPSSCPTPCWEMSVGELAKQPQMPLSCSGLELEGGLVKAGWRVQTAATPKTKPCNSLTFPHALPPPQLPLHRRVGHPVLSSGCQAQVP